MGRNIAFLVCVTALHAATSTYAAECYDNKDIKAATAFWNGSTEHVKKEILAHNQQLSPIAEATCTLARSGRMIAIDQFDTDWRRAELSVDTMEMLEDAAKTRPNFYRVLAALYGKVIPLELAPRHK